MKTIEELTEEISTAKADVEALRTTVHDGLQRIDADVNNLNAMIEALRQQTTDPAKLVELEAAVTSLRTTVTLVRAEVRTQIQAVDDKTPDLPETPPNP